MEIVILIMIMIMGVQQGVLGRSLTSQAQVCWTQFVVGLKIALDAPYFFTVVRH